MMRTLERTFGAWPVRGERPAPPPGPTAAAAHGWFMVDKDVNQARVSIGLRTIQRDDPDYFAALIMNDILGGGGFTARLVNRIRSDEGLAYQVGSALPDAPYYAEPWRTLFQSKVRSTAFAIDLAYQEIRRIRDDVVPDDELEVAKTGFIESFPARFATAQQIATALALEEFTGRYAKEPTYIATYRDRIRAVTPADVQRVARRLLDPSQFAVLIVGKKSDVLLGDGKHPSSVVALAGGPPVMLPLRDPLTMKPLATP
jgi:zinc protease